MNGEVLKLKDYQKKIFLMSRWAIAVGIGHFYFVLFVLSEIQMAYFPQSDPNIFFEFAIRAPACFFCFVIICGQFIALNPFAETPKLMVVWKRAFAISLWVIILLAFHSFTFYASGGYEHAEKIYKDPWFLFGFSIIGLSWVYSIITGWKLEAGFPFKLPPNEHPIPWKKPKETSNAS